MKIKEIGEFGLIGRIASGFRDLIPNGWEGIGDDCAVIPWGDDRSLLVTTDLLVENVHFLRERISAYELGAKSLAVNLSDIAAMGGRPAATFLSLGLPPARPIRNGATPFSTATVHSAYRSWAATRPLPRRVSLSISRF